MLVCACVFFKDVGKKKKEKRPLVSSLSYGGISLFPTCQQARKKCQKAR